MFTRCQNKHVFGCATQRAVVRLASMERASGSPPPPKKTDIGAPPFFLRLRSAFGCVRLVSLSTGQYGTLGLSSRLAIVCLSGKKRVAKSPPDPYSNDLHIMHTSCLRLECSVIVYIRHSMHIAEFFAGIADWAHMNITGRHIPKLPCLLNTSQLYSLQ